jgi:hypothetical protein
MMVLFGGFLNTSYLRVIDEEKKVSANKSQHIVVPRPCRLILICPKNFS